MIALMLCGAWLDALLDGMPAPWGKSFPPGMVVTPVVLLLALAAGRELARILREAGIQASTGLTAGMAMVGVLLSAFVPGRVGGVTGAAVVSFAVWLVLVGAMVYYGRNKRVEGMVAAAGGALLSFGVMGLMLGFIVTLRREHEVWILLWILLATKSCDIGAYAVGRAIGKRRLIGWLSPGKTWEGLVGGALFGAGVGGAGAWLLGVSGVSGSPGWVAGLGLGFVFALAGQAGDLFGSVLKRDAGRKDSGGSVPGFGGVIDVIDSLLLAAPVAYWLVPLAAG